MPDGHTPFPPLISVDRLGTMLGSPGLLIIDASWYLPKEGRDAEAEYRQAHIPGAIRLTLEQLGDPNSDLPHTAPTAQQFAEICESKGIGPRHHIVVYDGSGANLSAARVWWLFRLFGHNSVTVLDGGILSWAGATRPIQSGEQHRPSTGYSVPMANPELIVSKAELEAIVSGEADGQVVDCRSSERFNGTAAEPRPGLRTGNIVGSRNIPYRSFTNPDTGRFFSVPVLKELFASQDLSLDRRIVASCGSGVSACVLALAVEVVRLAEPGAVGPPVAIYDGSWAEWGREQAP